MIQPQVPRRRTRWLQRIPDLEQVRAEKVRRRLAAFVRQAWHILEPTTPLIWGWHMDAICEHLEAVSRHQIANLLITVPPGSSKSTIASVLWMPWHWIDDPSARFLTASYARELALRDAVRSRLVIQDPWYQAHWGDRFRMTGDQNVKGHYVNDQTGFRFSTSTDSGATGHRCNYSLIDDPHNVKDVESKAEREAVIFFHDRAFYNRVNDARRGGRVIIGQRTHQQDLIGHLKERGGWEEVRIPEEFEAGNRCVTVIGWSDPRLDEGQLLREERFGPEQVVEAKTRTLGSVGYAAQHQQRPVPAEGALFKKEWLDRARYGRLGDSYVLGSRHVPRSACRRFATVDHACSMRSSADYTVIAVWDDDRRGNLLLLDLVRDRIEMPDLPRRMQDVMTRWHPQYFGVESGSEGGVAAVQHLRRANLTIRELIPKKGKVEHSLAAQIKAEAGQIWLPQQASWLAGFEDELLHFPHVAHDDQCDTLFYAVDEMVRLSAQSTCKPLAVGGMPSLRP